MIVAASDPTPWFQDANTLTLAGVVVGVAALVAAIFQVRYAKPARRLLMWRVRQTPLLTDSARKVADLEVKVHGKALKQPAIVTLRLENAGRLDIPSSSFDAGKSIVFDLGVNVQAVIGTEVEPKSAPYADPVVDPLASSWTEVLIPPQLLTRGEVMTITLLVDGPPKPASLKSWPVADADHAEGVKGSPAGKMSSGSRKILALGALTFPVLVTVWMYTRQTAWLIWILNSVLLVVLPLMEQYVNRRKSRRTRPQKVGSVS